MGKVLGMLQMSPLGVVSIWLAKILSTPYPFRRICGIMRFCRQTITASNSISAIIIWIELKSALSQMHEAGEVY